jgi:hypothetical protein
MRQLNVKETDSVLNFVLCALNFVRSAAGSDVGRQMQNRER